MADKLTVLGARGPSVAELARRTGNYGVLPTDNDFTALEKLGQALLEENPGFQSTVPGPAGPTYTTLAGFRAAPAGNKKQALADPAYPFGDYYFETANSPYTENVPAVIKANGTPLTVGAWVRQSAAGIQVVGGQSAQQKFDDLDEGFAEQQARLGAVEVIKPAAEAAAIPLAQALNQVPQGPRDPITYASAQSVRIQKPNVVMGGFRIGGQLLKGRAPFFPVRANRVASLDTDQGALSATKAECWYNVFAVANPGDVEAQLRVMPSIRLGARSGETFAFVKPGEGFAYSAGGDMTKPTTYSWKADNNLAGTEVVCISEGNAFTGRVTTITGNTASGMTFANRGALAAGDFIVPAPPGFQFYCWLGDFYRDTAEVRNIYDSGRLVTAKMIYVLQSVDGTDISTGAYPAGSQSKFIDFRGYISPFARAVRIEESLALSTTSAGFYASYYDPDGGGHVTRTMYRTKDSTSTITLVMDAADIAFLYPQQFNYGTSLASGASLAPSAIQRQLNIVGWDVG